MPFQDMSDDELEAFIAQGERQAATGFTGGAPSAAPDKMARRNEFNLAAKQLADERKAVAGFASSIQSLDRFGDLNKKQGTGGWMHGVPFLKDKSWNGSQDPELGEMNSISSAFQVKGVTPGQGAVSNFERELYARGSPNISNGGNVNANIRGHMKGVYAQEQDRLSFMESYLNNRGDLSGAAEAWSKYTASNPYTRQLKTKSGEDRIEVNDKRTPWRQYFGVEAPTPAQALAAAPRKPAAKASQAGGVVRYDAKGNRIK